jgi:hypothetical protein
MIAAGTRLGPYEFISPLGSGAWALLHRGESLVTEHSSLLL